MTYFGRAHRLFYRDGESLSEISKKTSFRQRLLKQVAGRGMFAFRSHQKPVKIRKKSSAYYLIFGKYRRQEIANLYL